MSLDLGAVIGRVILDTAGFDAKYPALLRRMSMLGGEATKSSGGVRKLDLSLAGAGATANKAAVSMDRTAASTSAAAAAANKAAVANERQTRTSNLSATAQARQARVAAEFAALQSRASGMSARQAQAAYRLAAAQARVNEVQASGVATTRQLASAQAGLIAAQRSSQRAATFTATNMVAAGKKMSHAMTLPIVAAAALSIHSAAQFEQATNVYVTAAGESVKNLGVVRDGIKSIATETGTGIKNLTDAEYVLQKAGLRGAQGISVLRASAKGAREENAQLSDVVQAMTSVMSAYQIPASKAVQVMNALKTGAGSAKVSMEDYSRALSTVIPIAAANKISIDQVLGGFSQLTQAGNTAQYSTQLLSSTIRALAAPNRVAQKQMQQFGLNINDVTSKLGQRGLSGTLKLYIGAITKDMGKSGLVVQNAFNQQASAMADVKIMLDKMPASVKNLSKQYQDGKVSFGDWRQAVKELPTDQANLARDFAKTSDRTHAFNDLLKAGDPAAQTFTAALRKMTNGAIGMNTVMQLAGDGFKGLDARTAAVGHSLHNSSTEVEGWRSTAALASVKADRLMQSLHVLAINGGNALLPMFTRLADGLNSVVHGFQGLDSTQKQVLGWSLAIVAAVGPVLAISGRLMLLGGGIARAASFIGVGLARIAGASSTTSLAVQRNMTRVGAALGGAGIGFAIGTMTQNASGAAKAVGALGSAATGALIGFGAGGPVGAAVGAGAGLLANLATGFFNSGEAADSAVSSIQAFTDAILKDNRALGVNTRALVAHDFNARGENGKSTFDASSILGINPKAMTDAALGVGKAKVAIARILAQNSNTALGITRDGVPTAQITARARAVLGIGKDVTKLTDEQVGKLKDLAGASSKVRDALGLESDAVRQGQKDAERYADATSAAGKNDSARAKALKAVVAQQKAASKSLSGLTAQVGIHGTSLTPTKANGSANPDGASNLRTLSGLLAKYKQIEQAQVLAGASTKQAASGFDASTAAMRRQAVALGFSGKQVDALVSKYRQTPKQVVTTMLAHIDRATASSAQLQHVIDSIRQKEIPGLTADSAQGRAIIDAMQARINALTGKTVVIPIIPDFSKLPSKYVLPAGAKTGGGPNGNGFAAGGSAPEGYFAVGEEGPEIAHKDGNRVEIMSNPKSRAFIARTGLQFPGFAKGTASSNASNAVTAAGQSLTGLSLSSFDFSWNKFTDQIAKAARAVRDAARAGATVAQMTSLNARLHRAEDKGAKLERALGGSIRKSGAAVGALVNRNVSINPKTGKIQGSVAGAGEIVGGLRTMYAQLQQAGVPPQFIRGLHNDTVHIGNLAKSRNAAAAMLAKANAALVAARKVFAADKAAGRDAVTGTFDVTSAGADDDGHVTGGAMRAQQAQAVTRARAWLSGIKKLVATKWFPAAYIRQLVAKGPDALGQVQALLSMSKSGLRDFAHGEKQLLSLGNQVGQVAAVRLDQTAVNNAKADQKTWAHRERLRQRALNTELGDLATRLEHKLETLHFEGKLGITAGQLAVIVETGKNQNRSR